MRHYGAASLLVYSRLLAATFDKKTLGLTSYFPPGTKTQKITIKKTGERRAAVDALQSYFTKFGIGPDISANAAQAADELLLNAIFNAPRRRLVSRKAQFDLAPGETVDLEIAAVREYVGVCVTDHFGSLEKDAVEALLSREYVSKSWEAQRFGPGSGLGLYGIAQGGLSLLLACAPNVKTQAMIFFPRTKSQKIFKKSFKFVACFA